MELYTISALSKYYERWNMRLRKKDEIHVIKNLNLTISDNEFVCIIGKSGAGKTTLLKMLGGIEKPSTGSILYTNMELYKCPEVKMEEYRRKEIGFIFQDYKLLDEMTIQENILIPQILDGAKRETAESKVEEMTKQLDIYCKKNFYPYELSGGEKQRAAICRALINDPKVILADEPTGNLDSAAGAEIMDLLRAINRDSGQTILMVTHSPEAAKSSNRVITVKDGMIV